MTTEQQNISKDEMLELLCKTLENILSKTRFSKSNPLDRSFDISKLRPEAEKVVADYKKWEKQNIINKMGHTWCGLQTWE